MKEVIGAVCKWTSICWLFLALFGFLVSEGYATYLWLRGNGYDEGISGHVGRALIFSFAALPGLLFQWLSEKLGVDDDNN